MPMRGRQTAARPRRHPVAYGEGQAARIDDAATGRIDAFIDTVGGCSWPPVPGAAADGYANVDLELFNIPGSNSSEPFTDAMVVTTRCPAMLTQFKLVDQGTNLEEKPLLLAKDQVVSGYDGESAAIPDHGRSLV
jgi:hypothetical protein